MAVSMWNWLWFKLFNRRHLVLPTPEHFERRKGLTMNCKEASAAVVAAQERLRKALMD